MKINECTHVIFDQTIPHPSIDVHITSKFLLPFSSAISKVSYMYSFMIYNKCYLFEVVIDVGENCTMAMFGVGGWG